MARRAFFDGSEGSLWVEGALLPISWRCLQGGNSLASLTLGDGSHSEGSQHQPRAGGRLFGASSGGVSASLRPFGPSAPTVAAPASTNALGIRPTLSLASHTTVTSGGSGTRSTGGKSGSGAGAAAVAGRILDIEDLRSVAKSREVRAGTV